MTRHGMTPDDRNGSPIGSRRATGSGSVYESATGQWIAAVYLASGARVKRKRLTREAAEQALAELLLRDDLGFMYLWPKPYRFGTRPRQPRQGVTARVRFAVLERDDFRCRYCGAPAPEVRLTVDHVVPVAKGGSDDMENLVTACKDCNAGKADRELSA